MIIGKDKVKLYQIEIDNLEKEYEKKFNCCDYEECCELRRMIDSRKEHLEFIKSIKAKQDKAKE